MKAKQLIEELKSLVEAGDNPEVIIMAKGDVLKNISLMLEESIQTIIIFASEKR